MVPPWFLNLFGPLWSKVSRIYKAEMDDPKYLMVLTYPAWDHHNLLINLRCDMRFQHAFSACGCVFKVIRWFESNQHNYNRTNVRNPNRISWIVWQNVVKYIVAKIEEGKTAISPCNVDGENYTEFCLIIETIFFIKIFFLCKNG